MTQKLFWADPYSTTSKAVVTEIIDKKIKLDKTIFYAFSGGQESDSGTIGGLRVIQATKQGEKENIIDIEYELEEKPTFSVGDEVDVVIDKERRLALMKLHSSTHLIYCLAREMLGPVKIIGSHIAQEKARIDLEYDEPVTEKLPKLEKEMNAFLSQDNEIKRYADKKNPDMWWWECAEWKMPCGGTHVTSTAEIGSIQLKRKNIGKGKERIEIYLSEENS